MNLIKAFVIVACLLLAVAPFALMQASTATVSGMSVPELRAGVELEATFQQSGPDVWADLTNTNLEIMEKKGGVGAATFRQDSMPHFLEDCIKANVAHPVMRLHADMFVFAPLADGRIRIAAKN